jgi:hypothetical protein
VQAVRDFLVRSGFDVKVNPVVASLPREDSAKLRADLAACDVLVSCAASSPAQNYINHLARQLGLPCVVGSIKLMPQALGEVVLCPGAAPGCLNCWRLALEANKLMMREETHDPLDYPGQTAETPQGLPAYLLDQLASMVCSLISRGFHETESRVWLSALEKPVDGFEDLRPQEPRFEQIVPKSKCLVCRGK